MFGTSNNQNTSGLHNSYSLPFPKSMKQIFIRMMKTAQRFMMYMMLAIAVLSSSSKIHFAFAGVTVYTVPLVPPPTTQPTQSPSTHKPTLPGRKYRHENYGNDRPPSSPPPPSPQVVVRTPKPTNVPSQQPVPPPIHNPRRKSNCGRNRPCPP